MPHDELTAGLDKLADKLGRQYQLVCDWKSDDCLCFRRAGADGEVNIGEREIELSVNLGLMMSAFKSTIENEIRSFIDEHIY